MKMFHGRPVMDTIDDFFGEPVAAIELLTTKELTKEEIAYLIRRPFPVIELQPPQIRLPHEPTITIAEIEHRLPNEYMVIEEI